MDSLVQIGFRAFATMFSFAVTRPTSVPAPVAGMETFAESHRDNM